MPDNLARDFAAAKLARVVAPAGCGKTHLISDAVKLCAGRQLILTHTHAGVKAIRDRMARFDVPLDQFRVTTIDAFALKYAAAFPGFSGWTIREPEGEQWNALRPAALNACRSEVAATVLRTTYSGVFIDEYQDCTINQHELILQLATLLPCRVLGDGLQAIFWKINKATALSWASVEGAFPLLGELDVPHRWRGKNEELGSWLLHARKILLAGEVLDLTGAPGVKLWLGDPDEMRQLKACQELLGCKDANVVGLRAWRANCHRLSGRLNNAFTTFEDAQCEDLLKWTRKIEAVTGADRVEVLAEFAGEWLTRLPRNLIEPVVASVVGNKPTRARRADVTLLHRALADVRDHADFARIASALDAFTALEESPVYRSREIWEGLRHAGLAAAASGGTLTKAAWQHRETLRHAGRNPARRCLATPLLVKGLEFDHSAILNAGEFADAENLYVSLTRATRSVIVLSKSAKLSAPRGAK